MRKSKQTITKIPTNKKRKINKKLRGFGMGSIESLLGTENENIVTWCQSKDPLFKIKGKERHFKMSQYK